VEIDSELAEPNLGLLDSERCKSDVFAEEFEALVECLVLDAHLFRGVLQLLVRGDPDSDGAAVSRILAPASASFSAKSAISLTDQTLAYAATASPAVVRMLVSPETSVCALDALSAICEIVVLASFTCEVKDAISALKFTRISPMVANCHLFAISLSIMRCF